MAEKEKTFVDRYEELVRENKSLQDRLVAMDHLLEQGAHPLLKLYPIGDFCERVSVDIPLSAQDVRMITTSQQRTLAELEFFRSMMLSLGYEAWKKKLIDIAPKLSENKFVAQMLLVRLK